MESSITEKTPKKHHVVEGLYYHNSSFTYKPKKAEFTLLFLVKYFTIFSKVNTQKMDNKIQRPKPPLYSSQIGKENS
jgi:hypothetical protein